MAVDTISMPCSSSSSKLRADITPSGTFSNPCGVSPRDCLTRPRRPNARRTTDLIVSLELRRSYLVSFAAKDIDVRF